MYNLDLVDQRHALAVARLAKLRRKNRARPLLHRRDDGRVPEKLLEWSMVNRVDLRPGSKFSLRDHIYLKEIYENTDRLKCFMKASQLGLTEYLVSLAIHMNIERKGDVLYLMPTIGDVSDFSRSRMNTTIEASKAIAEHVVSATGTSRGADTIGLKRFDTSFMYMRGAGVDKAGKAQQLKSIPVDLVIFDELDEMDERAIPIAVQRMNHSPIREEVYNSTPTYHGFGIHKRWSVSDQREWFVPCPRCGERQQLLVENCIIEMDALERPIRWHGQNEGRAWVACVKCGGEMDRGAAGEWVATHPGRPLVGYHPTQLMAVHVPLIEIVNDLMDLSKQKRQETHNQRLGNAHTPEGGRMTTSILDKMRRDYAHGPVPGIKPSAGIDVGKMLHIVIRAPKENGERRQLWAGDVFTFEEAANVLRTYNVSNFVIDALPETRKARELQAQFPLGTGWLAYYQGAEKSEMPVAWNEKDRIVNIDRTRLLDEMYAGFYDGETSTLPATIESVRDYYDHMCAPVRVLHTKNDGTKVALYVGDAADHFAHAENYCLAASKRPYGMVASAPITHSMDDYFNSSGLFGDN